MLDINISLFLEYKHNSINQLSLLSSKSQDVYSFIYTDSVEGPKNWARIMFIFI